MKIAAADNDNTNTKPDDIIFTIKDTKLASLKIHYQ